MFRGRFYHTLDTKGRVSIPSGLRTELEKRSERAPILSLQPDCLHLYAREDWEAFEQRLAAVSEIDPAAQAYARFVLSSAVESPIDRQGRLSIPAFQREGANLERDAAIAGVGNRIEIWNAERFDSDLSTTRARFTDLASALAPKVGNVGNPSGGG